MTPKRPLMIQVKPPPAVAEHVWAFPQTDHRRPPGLLHMTVLPLWDSYGLSPQFILGLCRILGTIRAWPFELLFDRIEGRGRGIELVTCRRLPAAKSFRQLLAETLIYDFGLSLPRPKKLRPHITIDYRKGALPCTIPIAPVHWQAEDFVLVESVYGEARHIEHGRWKLRPGRAGPLHLRSER